MENNSVIVFDNVRKEFSYAGFQATSFIESIIKTVRRDKSDIQTLVAVEHLDFTVGRGEVLGLIGTNGSGKSTALKLATRIIRPTVGSVTVSGRVGALIELGAGFHPELTGRENVFLNASIMGMKKKEVEAKFDDIVTFSELEEFIDLPVKHYSSGMYMRLAFSVAVHIDPDILFVDEILSVGDQAFQNKCLDHIYTLKRKGLTIVMVSHDMQMMRNLCSRLIWIDRGVMKMDGEPEEVLAAYNAHLRQQEKSRKLEENISFTRWGSGDATIKQVRLLNAAGNEPEMFQTGEQLTVELAYETKRPISNPRFGLTFFREDGTLIDAPSSELGGRAIGTLSGSGTVRYTIDSLPFATGVYQLSASIHDSNGITVLDYHDRAYVLRVVTEETIARTGLITMANQWDINAD